MSDDSVHQEQERIIRAAILLPNGEMLSLPTPARHHDIIRVFAHNGPEALANQGFRTSRNRFVDRVEGLQIAQAAGQIKQKHGNANRLFTEDMW